MSARRLRGEVDVQRSMVARPHDSIVAKKRAVARTTSADSVFDKLCHISAPFISVGFLRQHIHAGLELPRGGRGGISESHFKFPVGHGKEDVYAILSKAHRQVEEEAPEEEAQEVLELLTAAADEDLIFWSYLCLPADDDEGRDAVLRIFNLYSVQSILKCSPERSLVRLCASVSTSNLTA
jgi:hypothetical protein